MHFYLNTCLPGLLWGNSRDSRGSLDGIFVCLPTIPTLAIWKVQKLAISVLYSEARVRYKIKLVSVKRSS